MSDEMIERACALDAAASPGPWAIESAGLMDACRARVIALLPSDPDAQDEADQEFMAASRTLVPDLASALLAERERAEEAERRAVEWHEAYESADDRAKVAVMRAEAAEARVASLEAALRRYGRHGMFCASLDASGPCDCGLAAVLGEQEATPPEPLDWEKHAQVALEAMAAASAPQGEAEPEKEF